MTRALIIASAAAVAIVGVRATVTEDVGIPFVSVRQGITPYQLGETRVFVVRAGSVVTAFNARSGRAGAPVQWCPREGAWWAPKTQDLFSESGTWVFGPVNHDMVQFKTRVSDEGNLFIDLKRPIVRDRGDGRAEIAKEIFEFYQRYLNYDPSLPTPTRPVFCPNPLT